MEEHNPGKAGIPIAVGIIVGLLASFVQSLGLTIQRKSHVQNDLLPLNKQRKTYRRPLWLFGFAVFISSNLFGTVFQIGALPIIVLAPLGAVSLLWNAVLSRILLRERFSARTLAGTCLIATGASLIAIFGVVPEENHTLEELMRLFRRNGFVIYITLMSAAVVGVLVVSHIAEFSLKRQQALGAISLPAEEPESRDPSDYGSIVSRRQSIPFRRTNTAAERHAMPPAASSGESTPITRSAFRQFPADKNIEGMVKSIKRVHYRDPTDNSIIELVGTATSSKDTRKTTLLGLSFAACSGTLSGMSLLFAKCAVELLILTFASKGKENQFKTVQSWILLLGLGITALAQLYYLNHSLALAGPAVICPLAFCFYNISSIFDGLVFYSQFSELAPHQIALVTVGIAVLLVGVWSVSAIEKTGEGGVQVGSWADEPEFSDDEDDTPYMDEPSEMGNQDDTSIPPSPVLTTASGPTPPMSPSASTHSKRRRSSGYQAIYGTLIPELAPPGVPAGFSIGFNTSSPGFSLRTAHGRSNSMGEMSDGITRSHLGGGKRGLSLDRGRPSSGSEGRTDGAGQSGTREALGSDWIEDDNTSWLPEPTHKGNFTARMKRWLGRERSSEIRLPE